MPAVDTTANLQKDMTTPPEGAFDVTTHNTNEQPFVMRRLYVGTGGNVRVGYKDGSTVTYKNVPDGSYIGGRIKRVYTTGTTASDLIGEL